MRVLCIVSHEDSNSGNVTAVVELPDGASEDAVFVAWLKANSTYWRDKPDKQCMEAEYAWGANTVQKVQL